MMGHTQSLNLIMLLDVVFGAWVWLNDRSVDAALIHPPDHVFFRCKQPKNAALSEMSVVINLLSHP
jgi:hypothetical protein